MGQVYIHTGIMTEHTGMKQWQQWVMTDVSDCNTCIGNAHRIQYMYNKYNTKNQTFQQRFK